MTVTVRKLTAAAENVFECRRISAFQNVYKDKSPERYR